MAFTITYLDATNSIQHSVVSETISKGCNENGICLDNNLIEALKEYFGNLFVEYIPEVNDQLGSITVKVTNITINQVLCLMDFNKQSELSLSQFMELRNKDIPKIEDTIAQWCGELTDTFGVDKIEKGWESSDGMYKFKNAVYNSETGTVTADVYITPNKAIDSIYIKTGEVDGRQFSIGESIDLK